MEVLDRSDVETASRLRGDEHARVAIDLTSGDELLLVSAREIARLRQRIAAAAVHAQAVAAWPEDEPLPSRVSQYGAEHKLASLRPVKQSGTRKGIHERSY